MTIKVMRKFLLTLAVCAMLPVLGSAQKKCWTLREAWKNPRFDTENLVLESNGRFEGNRYYELRFKKEEEDLSGKNELWKVYTDRANVRVLMDADPDSQPVPGTDNLKMGTMFYVAGEDGDYLLVKGSEGNQYPDERPELGYVLKEHLVLWEKPLRTVDTGIDIKAFIVNTADYAQFVGKDQLGSTKDIYKIYDGPDKSAELMTRGLYEVLFVYKYDEEGQRFLLSDHYDLGTGGRLTGWVSKNRVKLWETTLALEPNYNIRAIEDRRMDEGRYARVFLKPKDAGDYVKGLNPDPIIIRDVAKEGEKSDIVVDEGDKIRFDGKIPRWPLYRISSDSYDCGVIGKINLGSDPTVLDGITDEGLARAQKKFQGRGDNLMKTNVVFVVEMVPESKDYVDVIEDVIQGIYNDLEMQDRSNFSWGFVGYSDTYCGDNNAVEYINPLTREADDFVYQLNQFAPIESGPDDDFSAVNLALYKALTECGMNEQQTNIIIHLGKHAEVSMDFLDRAADLEECPEQLTVSNARLWQAMDDMTLHYCAMELSKSNVDEEFGFKRGVQDLMENVSRKMYDVVSAKPFFDEIQTAQKAPEFGTRDDAKGEMKMSDNAVSLMQLMWPERMSTDFGPERFKREAIEVISRARLKAEEEFEAIQKLYSDNSTLSSVAGDFQNVGNILRSNNLTEEEIKMLMKMRVQLYWDGVAPKECFGCSEGDMYNLTMFLSESAVDDIKDGFETLNDAKNFDVEERRRIIKEFWEGLALATLNMQDDGNLKIDEVRRKMTGLEEGGVPLGNGLLQGLTLNGVETLTADEITEYLDACDELSKFWEGLSTKSPFVYNPGGEEQEEPFYWVPFEKIY